MKAVEKDVGVIVGRFQVHELHEAHFDLIQSVADRHDRVFLFLGLSEVRNTKQNPLDFNARKQMIQEKFPDVEVHYIRDMPCDYRWSQNLDDQIKSWKHPNQSVVLYGSRSSFISRYHGAHETCELEPEVIVSGTEMRKKISAKTMASKDFRAGVIWASYHRYDTCYTTVDVAVLDHANERLLLCQKPGETKYMFIGGFSTPFSKSFEDDAIREVKEEAVIDLDEVNYIGSSFVDDWRYRSESDKIKTLFFWSTYKGSKSPEPNDDIAALKWFNLEEMISGYSSQNAESPYHHLEMDLKEQVLPVHHVLIEMFVKEYKQMREMKKAGI